MVRQDTFLALPKSQEREKTNMADPKNPKEEVKQNPQHKELEHKELDKAAGGMPFWW
jgi:hypothetical protein